ncbi:hypothetical protein C2G38_2190794 [Gigaspora rosea]|uniref:Uncharacterized protein n=1 Tax=Gigaspora rosea TaxID=44941 RepID=A0A397V5E6_9GLOM|nr:hypothetical protein C2G38_2190794 [Gigaspora rosea]
MWLPFWNEVTSGFRFFKINNKRHVFEETLLEAIFSSNSFSPTYDKLSLVRVETTFLSIM